MGNPQVTMEAHPRLCQSRRRRSREKRCQGHTEKWMGKPQPCFCLLSLRRRPAPMAGSFFNPGRGEVALAPSGPWGSGPKCLPPHHPTLARPRRAPWVLCSS